LAALARYCEALRAAAAPAYQATPTVHEHRAHLAALLTLCQAHTRLGRALAERMDRPRWGWAANFAVLAAAPGPAGAASTVATVTALGACGAGAANAAVAAVVAAPALLPLPGTARLPRQWWWDVAQRQDWPLLRAALPAAARCPGLGALLVTAVRRGAGRALVAAMLRHGADVTQAPAAWARARR
jgi:hypothetical protein